MISKSRHPFWIQIALIVFFLPFSLIGSEFDCILIGSSPFSLFEALYQFQTGNKVLVLEESSRCGGAWKGIDVCGISQVDLGCHQIGHDEQLKQFLETYAGCRIVSIDHPRLPFDSKTSPNGWYFSKGCPELIEQLLKLIRSTDIVILTEHKVDKVVIDSKEKQVHVYTENEQFKTGHLILTPTSSFALNPPFYLPPSAKWRYFHLYLLIQDPTPPQFSYRTGFGKGISRIMNLTHFAGLSETGRQLIVIQTHGESNLANGQLFLDTLKKGGLVDPGAYILASEPYIYETGAFQQHLISDIGAQELISVLQTGHFHNMSAHIPRWKTGLKPYREMVPDEMRYR